MWCSAQLLVEDVICPIQQSVPQSGSAQPQCHCEWYTHIHSHPHTYSCILTHTLTHTLRHNHTCTTHTHTHTHTVAIRQRLGIGFHDLLHVCLLFATDILWATCFHSDHSNKASIREHCPYISTSPHTNQSNDQCE